MIIGRKVDGPTFLACPERGLFTGAIMIGATGSGKTAGGMYPFTDQLLGYRAADVDAKASALILEVKADFCGKVNVRAGTLYLPH
jgi:hypothetical protein